MARTTSTRARGLGPDDRGPVWPLVVLALLLLLVLFIVVSFAAGWMSFDLDGADAPAAVDPAADPA